ncbi:peptidoglycan DD-metalloendopeptidase family protein [Cohnella lubricantis]|uniref:murein hydrolase activator EnvC family protein n=1 Tax=Cohnella lubricantis TaxID=2163172 RepID=UPI0035D556E4|nr:murein DD-endopeptidase MepM/ murein hydrolase activator NlpD [Cohnella lubricantis]
MRRKLVAVVAMLIAFACLVRPYDSHAETQLEKIEKQLKQIQQQMNEASKSKKEAEQEAQALSEQKEATKEELEQLMQQLAQASDQLDATQKKVDEAQEKLLQTTQELEDAEEQRQNKDELLQSRLRLMYTNGAVSYLDVLLSSTSFSDFISRFDALQSITAQDKLVLTQAEEYEALVTEKKAQVESELKEVEALYNELADRKAALEVKEQSKEAMVAKLSEKIEETDDISEEAEKAMVDLAKQYSEALTKKNQLKTYYTGGKLGLPLKASYRISSPFGYRTHPVTGEKEKLHTGIDMAVPKGTPIYAAESGVVITAQSVSGYGNTIIIDHGGGLWTLYGHIMPGGILVKNGETVKRGEKIGLVGMTGTATGYHLHFEVRKDGKAVDPAPYLK